jgi:thymidine phosphorylase
LVLDIPVGPTAKVRDRRAALRLRKLFEFVGGRLGLAVDVVISDGAQPVGRGVGPVLEARDVRAVLEGRPDAPEDLRAKALLLAGRMLETDPALRGGQGAARAAELLNSGAAARKLDEISAAQGPSPVDGRLGSLVHEVRATSAGWVQSIDCLRIATIARVGGAPTDPGAGVDLLVKSGERVQAGQPIYRVHGAEPCDFRLAVDAASEDSGYRMAP